MYKEMLYKEVIETFLYPKKPPLSALFSNLSMAEFMLIGSFLTFEKNNSGKHITVNELAADMGITVPGVSRSLKNLEERGLIERVTDRECRRNTFVVITSMGLELFKANEKVIKSLVNKVLNLFTEEELRVAVDFQRRAFGLLDDEIKTYLDNKENLK